MIFLRINENSKLARTCYQLSFSYKTLWTYGEYFSEISSQNYSEAELRLICQKNERLHSTIIREMVRGKKIELFQNRNTVSFKTTQNPNKKIGVCFEKFSVGPGRNINLQPFFSDDNFKELVDSSHHSLQNLIIRSCFLLTQKAFGYITRLLNLRSLFISTCRVINDNHLIDISQTCRLLREFGCPKCEGLTEKSLTRILLNCFQLENLDVSGNSKMFVDFTTFSLFRKPVFLTHLNIANCGIEMSQILDILQHTKSLKEIVLDGFFIRNTIADVAFKSKLKCLPTFKGLKNQEVHASV